MQTPDFYHQKIKNLSVDEVHKLISENEKIKSFAEKFDQVVDGNYLLNIYTAKDNKKKKLIEDIGIKEAGNIKSVEEWINYLFENGIPDPSNQNQHHNKDNNDFNNNNDNYNIKAEKLNMESQKKLEIEENQNSDLEMFGRIYKQTNLQKGDCIGEGSYGRVLKGKLYGRDIAIKELSFLPKNYKWNSFRQEVELMLPCPEIVQVYGVCNDYPQSILMELMDCSLYDLINAEDPGFDDKIKLSIASDVASGLEYLHLHDIIHRDIKSPNILLNKTTFKAKLADFGLAMKNVKTKSQKSTVSTKIIEKKGTIRWMSPEAIEGKESRKNDVYSFGVVLWEMWTGKIPYEELELYVVPVQIKEGKLLEIPDNIPPPIRTLIGSCFTPKETRPQIKTVLLQINELRGQKFSINYHRIDKTEKRKKLFQTILNKTSGVEEGLGHGRDVKDADKRGEYNALEIQTIYRITDSDKLESYKKELDRISKDMGYNQTSPNKTRISEELSELGSLNSSSNEQYLFTGTKPQFVDKILTQGFSEKYGSLNGMFGVGIYLTDSAGKADQYTSPVNADFQVKNHQDQELYIFLCRVVLGTPFKTKQPLTQKSLGLEKPVMDIKQIPEVENSKNTIYHSVWAEAGSTDEYKLKRHSEMIIYNGNQCFPEYLIIYKRKCIPSSTLLIRNAYDIQSKFDLLFQDVELNNGKIINKQIIPIRNDIFLTFENIEQAARVKDKLDGKQIKFNKRLEIRWKLETTINKQINESTKKEEVSMSSPIQIKFVTTESIQPIFLELIDKVIMPQWKFFCICHSIESIIEENWEAIFSTSINESKLNDFFNFPSIHLLLKRRDNLLSEMINSFEKICNLQEFCLIIDQEIHKQEKSTENNSKIANFREILNTIKNSQDLLDKMKKYSNQKFKGNMLDQYSKKRKTLKKKYLRLLECENDIKQLSAPYLYSLNNEQKSKYETLKTEKTQLFKEAQTIDNEILELLKDIYQIYRFYPEIISQVEDFRTDQFLKSYRGTNFVHRQSFKELNIMNNSTQLWKAISKSGQISILKQFKSSEKFYQESYLLDAMDHPNIIPMHSFFEDYKMYMKKLIPHVFEINVSETIFGQSVYVVGNADTIGFDDKTKAMELHTNNEIFPLWKSNEILLPPKNLKYRYFIAESGHFIKWVSDDLTLDLCKKNEENFCHATFVEFPYYKNGNLRTFLEKEDNLLTKRAGYLQEIFSKLLRALEYLEQKNILHLNITPDNILLQDEWTPILGGFGYSCYSKDLKNRDLSFASKNCLYYSPELKQKDISKIQCTSDIFSFAVVILEFFLKDLDLNTIDPSKYLSLIQNRNNITQSSKSFLKKALLQDPKMRPKATSCRNQFSYFRQLPNQSFSSFGSPNKSLLESFPENFDLNSSFGVESDQISFLPYWKESNPNRFAIVDISKKSLPKQNDKTFIQAFEELMNYQMENRWEETGTGTTSHGQQFHKFKVQSVHQIENSRTWTRYFNEKKRLENKFNEKGVKIKEVKVTTMESGPWLYEQFGTSKSLNEVFLFHGPEQNKKVLEFIYENGIDERYFHPGLFGAGAYFAEHAIKSDEYAQIPKKEGRYAEYHGHEMKQIKAETLRSMRILNLFVEGDRLNKMASEKVLNLDPNNEYVMLVNRAILGDPYICYHPTREGLKNDARLPPKKPESDLDRYNSILAECECTLPENTEKTLLQRNREFVLFAREQIYPEFIITYKRDGISSPESNEKNSSSSNEKNSSSSPKHEKTSFSLQTAFSNLLLIFRSGVE